MVQSSPVHRFKVRPFTRDSVDAAAELLADRHRRHRLTTPALNQAFEQPAMAKALVAKLADQADASGAVVLSKGDPVAYVLGTRRADSTWGANVWIEDAGSAGTDAEAIREAYAAAAATWVDAGRTSHYVVVPAADQLLVEAWFSLGFGQQHIHAVREPPPSSFAPVARPGVVIRRPTRGDLPALAELDLLLPRHQAGSPVFARVPIPTFEETLAEMEADFDDPRFVVFVAEHKGRVVGTAVGCSLELSPGHSALMKPTSAGFLGFAAVVPDARGLGAGRALADAVMVWSRDAGYEWVAIDWRSTNLEANRSWRAMGFEPTFLRLHRAIT
jgi:GNAT superfamily N-acetyltransferase